MKKYTHLTQEIKGKKGRNVDWDTVGDDLVVLAIILGIVAFISTVLVAW